MEGWIVAFIVWYAALTYAGRQVATWYDNTLVRRERELIPTAFLVVIGVGGTEILRFLRLAPAVWWFLANSLGYPGWQGLLIWAGIWTLDSLLGYAATGLPMIEGDLRRSARRRVEADTVADEGMHEIVERITDGHSSGR